MLLVSLPVMDGVEEATELVPSSPACSIVELSSTFLVVNADDDMIVCYYAAFVVINNI